MPLLVLPPVTIPRIRIIALGRYRVSCAMLGNIVTNLFGAIGLVAHYNTAGYLHQRKYICGNSIVVYIAACKKQFNWITKPIYNSVDFRVLTAARSTNVLVRFRA